LLNQKLYLQFLTQVMATTIPIALTFNDNVDYQSIVDATQNKNDNNSNTSWSMTTTPRGPLSLSGLTSPLGSLSPGGPLSPGGLKPSLSINSLSADVALSIINRKQIQGRYTSNKGNKYIQLDPPRIPYISVYRLSTVCPAVEILLNIKQYLNLPIDISEIVKISSYHYLLFPGNNVVNVDNNDGTVTKSFTQDIFDPLPLHKIPNTCLHALDRFKSIIQKFLLYRYIMGLNMSQSMLYCTFKSDTEIEAVYSHKESKPFGLNGKLITNVVDFKEKKTMRFGARTLKRWFYPYQPGQILAQWWQFDIKGKDRVLRDFYVHLVKLVVDKPCYQILPDLIIRRIEEALLPK
jgi:hypothetical protein